MSSAPTPTTTIGIEPVAGRIGADITGVDLSAPVMPNTVADLKKALLTYRVLFFRDQHLDHREHIAFARLFGDLAPADPHQPPVNPDYPEILVVDPQPDEDRYGADYEERYRRRRLHPASSWHIDNSPTLNPPAASILRADTVPAYGGDTQWTNLVAAYRGLSAPIQNILDGLCAEHRYLAGFHMPPHDPEVAEIVEMITARPFITAHPIVRVIPETEERALFLSPSTTSHIIGVSATESRALLDLLFDHLARDEYRVRFRWRPGSVAFWDNRTTAHLAALDHAHLNTERRLYRVTLLGDQPIGPGALRSASIAGAPTTTIL